MGIIPYAISGITIQLNIKLSMRTSLIQARSFILSKNKGGTYGL